MKTKCFCVYCSNHPLYNERNNLPVVVGWTLDRMIFGDCARTGVDVECLQPESDAFFELDISPDEHEFPITAYGDGSSNTGFEGMGYVVHAYCSKEDYEGNSQ